jgi:hypothetical protein
MTALCSGLAILGLCLPLPSQPVDALVQAGWRNEGGIEEWFASRTFASGTFELTALVVAHAGVVLSVLIHEVTAVGADQSKTPLNLALLRACSLKGGKEQCLLEGKRFSRMQCAGGWLLFAKGADVSKAKCCEARLLRVG